MKNIGLLKPIVFDFSLSLIKILVSMDLVIHGKLNDQSNTGGKCMGLQALSSPWDVLLYKTPDMDMSVRPTLPPPPPPPGAPAQPHKDKDDEKGKAITCRSIVGNSK